MTDKKFKRESIILITALTLIVIAAFSVGIYVFLSNDDTTPVINKETDDIYNTDTSIAPESESTPDSEANTDTEQITDNNDTEETTSGQLTFDEANQLLLAEKQEEIIGWLNTAIPTYKTEPETDENGIELNEPEEYTPNVSFFYMDLTNGYTMEYNADRVFYTASVIKEPYILWVLNEIEKKEADNVAKGTKYDVESLFVYTEDKFKSGSGIIQKEKFGTEFSYLDLLRLTITYSDNVAFAELRNIYGRSGFNEFSEKIGVKNPQKSLFSATAREMGAYLKETYSYFESNTKYADMLKNWMQSTNHRIMIPSAVQPLKAANKYGWDLGAYHDMAIVFHENPYLLVVMTELENGSKADNAFIRELVNKINSAHSGIYNDDVSE